MAAQRWGEAGMTIVLLPDGEQGDSLLGVARQWTDMKLLSRAVWVKPEYLDSEQSNPPRQRAMIIGADRDGEPVEVEVDLFEQLARQQLLAVRLLVVRSVSEHLEFDSAQDRLATLLDQYLTVALPLPISAGYDREKYTQFVRLNLITAPTEYQSADGNKLVTGRFNANFVAAAEDRSAPLAGDAFMRHDPTSKRFAAFTLMHVATIGALWSGLPQGLYELLKPSGPGGSELYVSRVFVSAILTDGLARRASTRVLKRVGDPAMGAVDFSSELPVAGTYQIADSDRDKFIESMVNLTFEFDGGKLSYRPSPEAERVRTIQQSLDQQASSFFTFAWDKIVSIPRHMVRGIHRIFATTLNALLHGGDDTGYASIRVPDDFLDPRDRMILDKREQIGAEKERADLTLVSPVTPSDVRSSPELWENLRQLVFGMLDGSNLEKFGYPEGENGWPIFYRVSDLFADPAAKIQVGDEGDDTISLSWSRSTEALEIMQQLSRDNMDSQQQMDGFLREVLDARTRVAEFDDRIVQLEAFLGMADEEDISNADSEVTA